MTDDVQLSERSKWLALALLATTQFVIVLDAAIVNVAIPTIGRDLHFSLENLAWIPNAYALTFGGFLLLGGRMADLLGRRRLFMGGLILFVLASLAGGLSQNETQLIAFRALQGLGAAMLAPSALSMVTNMFTEGAERNKALGVWGAVSGSGGAAGVLLGGVLTQYAGWEWVLWVNVPIGLIAAFLAPRLLVESRAETEIAPLRRARRGRDHGRAVDPRLRARRCRDRRLGIDADDRAARAVVRADRRLRRDREPLRRAARAVSDLPPAHADGRERHRPAASARRCSRCSSSCRATCRRSCATTR